MLKRVRRASGQVTLVLIGAAAVAVTLAGCAKNETRRDVYASRQDCLADWGNTPSDCEPAYDRPTGNANTTHYYGRPYSHSGSSSMTTPSSSRAISTSTTSRGGFGSSGHSAAG